MRNKGRSSAGEAGGVQGLGGGAAYQPGGQGGWPVGDQQEKQQEQEKQLETNSKDSEFGKSPQ